MEPFASSSPSTTEKTRIQYVRRFEWIRGRFMGELGKLDMTPDEVVAHLILTRTQNSARTFRVYKAAAIYYLETFYPQSETALEELRRQSSAGLRGGGSNTSSRKKKEVPESEWVEIQHAINERIRQQYKYAAPLLAVLGATLLTGLRPMEWALSELDHHPDDGRKILRVRNAKHTNGRANGTYREMYVDTLTPTELALVERALRACACDTDDQAEKLQTALKHELEAARSLAVAGKRRPRSSITLYSFRHQFVANAKLTFDDPAITAALSGHISTKTAHRHYGKRRHGRAAVRVYPTESTMAAVQNRYLETYRDFVAKRGPINTPVMGSSQP